MKLYGYGVFFVGKHISSCVCSVTSVVSDCGPMDCSPPGSSGHGFSRQEYQLISLINKYRVAQIIFF